MMLNPCVEAELYDKYALSLKRGEEVVDQSIYERAITSRRNTLISDWLPKEQCLILDYGCGDGESSRFLARLNHQVVAFDLSKGMIAYAKSKDPRRISYLVASGEELPLRDGVFDAVVGIGIFHHLHLSRGLKECHRSLKPNGGLGIMEPNTLNPFSFVGRRALRTQIHTPEERTYTLWFLRDNIRKAGFAAVSINMISFIGYSMAFLSAWLNNRKQLRFRKLVSLLRKSTTLFIFVDKFFENLPLVRNTCWIIAINAIRTQ
jgi:SAM-dependent methyltransferase